MLRIELQLFIKMKDSSHIEIKNIDSNIKYKIDSGCVVLTGEAKQLKYQESSSMSYFVGKLGSLETQYAEAKISEDIFQQHLSALDRDIETVLIDLRLLSDKSGSALSKFQQEIVQARKVQIREVTSRKSLGKHSVTNVGDDNIKYLAKVSQITNKYVHKK